MTYLSVCSGIEAATVAWHPLGWSPVAFSEIEKFPCAVLAHHYPQVPNWGDMTRFHEWAQPCGCLDAGDSRARRQFRSGGAAGRVGKCRPHVERRAGRDRGWRNSDCASGGVSCEQCGGTVIDLLVGGTPCQSFSVAGLRAGLDDPRGSLMLTYLAVARRYRPRWVVWENVPGVLSADDGRAFGSLLGGLAGLGYGFAHTVLDAQYFGLAQRRQRVFVIGHLGDWRRAAAVLFERESLSGHPAPRREAGQDVAECVAGSLGSRGNRSHTELDGHGAYVPVPSTGDISHCLNAGGMGRIDYETETLIAHAFDARQSDVLQYGDLCGPLDTDGCSIGVAVPILEAGARTGKSTTDIRAGIGIGEPGDPMFTLQAGKQHGVAMAGMAVRRLTPRECERLQGFPDDYTLIPYRGKPAADGPRYKALGNSMAVPCMAWIGRRIALVDSL